MACDHDPASLWPLAADPAIDTQSNCSMYEDYHIIEKEGTGMALHVVTLGTTICTRHIVREIDKVQCPLCSMFA